MKPSFYIILLFAAGCKGQPQSTRHGEAPGNNIINFKATDVDSANGSRGRTLVDPVDDTINYRKVSGVMYKDTSGKAFVLSVYQDARYLASDSSLFVQYYQDVSEQIDLKTYRLIEDDYFTTKGKVFLWWGDMQHSFPVEVIGADPNSFKPFDKLAGGVDKARVFYGGPPSDFQIISGANPKTIKILNPKKGCWNCGDCYFTDDKHVFFGNHLIKGADPKTFKLVNQDQIDAIDKRHQYFDGTEVKRKGKL